MLQHPAIVRANLACELGPPVPSWPNGAKTTTQRRAPARLPKQKVQGVWVAATRARNDQAEGVVRTRCIGRAAHQEHERADLLAEPANQRSDHRAHSTPFAVMAREVVALANAMLRRAAVFGLVHRAERQSCAAASAGCSRRHSWRHEARRLARLAARWRRSQTAVRTIAMRCALSNRT